MQDQNNSDQVSDQMSDSNVSASDTKIHDFERLTDGLRSALSKFQADSTPENFAVIVTALSEFGISGADIWHQVAAYSKRHPIRVGLLAGLAFFAMKGLAPIAKSRMPMVH